MKEFLRDLNLFWQKVPTRAYFIVFATVAILLIIALIEFSDEDTGPCSSSQYFGECYDIPRSLCESTLAVIKSSCDGLVKSMTKPGQLVGPIQRNCEQLKFDRILKYTRKSISVCTDRVQYLETWQKSNPDF